jgi:hypothetical protein
MYRGSAADWLRLDEVHRSQVDLTARGLLRDVDAGANVAFISKTPGFRGYSGLAGPLFELYANDPVLRASATGRDRLWFSQSAVIVERTEPCFEAFRARARQLGEVPIVLHTMETMRRGYVRDLPAAATMRCDSPSTAVAAMRLDAAAVNVVQYRPTRLTFDVDVPRAGWLLVATAGRTDGKRP